MKKKALVMVVAALFCGTVAVQAQDECKHEVGVAYGAVANSNILDLFDDAFSNANNPDPVSGSYFGPLSVEYYYRVSPMIGVGGVAVVKTHKETSRGGEAYTNKYFTVMPSVKFNWVHKAHFGFYSKLAAGYTFFSTKFSGESGSAGAFNFQASVIGLEAGGRLRGFAELGWGEQGLALAGIRYRF